MRVLHRQLVLVAAATIAVDLASKAGAVRWLNDPVDLGFIAVRATENSGVAFGIGADQPFAVVAALTGLVVAGMAVGAWRGLLGGPVGAGLIVGGGTANLADRLVGGSVVDLFDLGWWPVLQRRRHRSDCRRRPHRRLRLAGGTDRPRGGARGRWACLNDRPGWSLSRLLAVSSWAVPLVPASVRGRDAAIGSGRQQLARKSGYGLIASPAGCTSKCT